MLFSARPRKLARRWFYPAHEPAPTRNWRFRRLRRRA
jgi:hypothetical protein